MSRTWRRDDMGHKNHGDSRRNKRREKRHFDDLTGDRLDQSHKKYNSNLGYREYDVDIGLD